MDYELKKVSEPVSRVLYSPKGMLAIYLRAASPLSSIVLPSGSDGPPSRLCRLVSSISSAGLHELSTPGVHSTGIAAGLVGSYPTFSPLPVLTIKCLNIKTGGSFLLHLLTLADLFPLGSGMPCVARTFLSSAPSPKRPPGAAASRFTVFSFLCFALQR